MARKGKKTPGRLRVRIAVVHKGFDHLTRFNGTDLLLRPTDLAGLVQALQVAAAELGSSSEAMTVLKFTRRTPTPRPLQECP
jgi:hypothetical protein